MEREVRRGVRFNRIALAALAVLARIGMWALLRWTGRPLDQNITPNVLAENLSGDTALGKIGEVYYVLSDTEELVDTLSLPDWTITQDTAEEPLAVFCLGEDARGVSLSGLKYPLNNARLTAFHALGVSNAHTGAPVEICVQSGTLLVLDYAAGGIKG